MYNKYKNNEIEGKAGPKSAQTCRDNHVLCSYIPMLAFLNEKFMLSQLVGVGDDCGITIRLVCYPKSKHRDV